MMLADKNFAKTLTSGIMARISQLFRQNQSDWNVSDPDSPSYVKNRTHWAEPGQLVYLIDDVTIVNGNNDWMPFDTFSLKVGQKYTVTFDGTNYDCVCFDDDGYPTIGDAYENIFVNYPFFVSSNPDYTEFATIDDAEHMVSISTIEEKVHKIDEKYLPDVDYVGKYGTGHKAEIFNHDQNVADGNYSHAEGSNTFAWSYSSHAEGTSTQAYGQASHAEGLTTVASGNGSHSEGSMTSAAGDYSHAEGQNTIARGVSSHVQGKYNIEDTAKKYAHIVGNGTSTTRSNAHTLDWDGNAWFAGTIEGKAMIVDSATEGSTKKFRVDIDDTGTMKSSDTETGDVCSTSVPPSGGTPYQQLVTDGDGNAKWEDRLAYVSGCVENQLLPEQTYSGEEAVLNGEGELVLGKTYSVMFDGVEYECICAQYETALTIGNASFAKFGDDTGEPFFIMYIDRTFFATSSDVLATHTISVSCVDEVVKEVDRKFLPKEFIVNIVGEESAENGNTYLLFDKTDAEINTASQNGSVIKLKYYSFDLLYKSDEQMFWGIIPNIVGSNGITELVVVYVSKTANGWYLTETYITASSNSGS